MKSKEDNLMDLFYNNPTKEWHFEEIVKEAKVARSKAAKWLRFFAKEKLIKRIKDKGLMPYFISDYHSPSYQNRKRIYAMNKMYESGLLNHLCSLKNSTTVIIFGSFSRWDWHKNSDIDLFVFGDSEGLKIGEYELKLQRDIQVFEFKDKAELSKLGSGLLRNIIKGDIIIGDIGFIGVGLNA